MDSSQIQMIIIFVILIALSALFSSSETAFMSVSKIRIKTLAQEGNKKAQTIESLLADTDTLLGTILIGNNLVNIAASSLTTSLVLTVFNGSTAVAVATGFVTLIILIFGEMTPKTLATKSAEKFTFVLCPLFKVLTVICKPIVKVLNVVSGLFIRLFGGNKDHGPSMTEEDLKTIVSVSHEEGVLEDEEKEMIHNVFEFGDTEIKEIMTPRIHVEQVSDDISYNELMDVFRECQFSRLPVHSEDYDEIIGVVYVKDLILDKIVKATFDIKEHIRDAYFVYEFNRVSDVFETMRKDRKSFSIVLDEYGVMSGIVTLEDIVEEIVGEIDDEYDEEEESIIDLGHDTYLIDGSLNIDEVNEECHTHFESEDFESIGGLVLGQFHGSPEVHKSFEFDDARITIEKVDKNRIVQLKLTLIEEEKEEHD